MASTVMLSHSQGRMMREREEQLRQAQAQDRLRAEAKKSAGARTRMLSPQSGRVRDTATTNPKPQSSAPIAKPDEKEQQLTDDDDDDDFNASEMLSSRSGRSNSSGSVASASDNAKEPERPALLEMLSSRSGKSDTINVVPEVKEEPSKSLGAKVLALFKHKK
jgi:hypothetical protein